MQKFPYPIVYLLNFDFLGFGFTRSSDNVLCIRQRLCKTLSFVENIVPRATLERPGSTPSWIVRWRHIRCALGVEGVPIWGLCRLMIRARMTTREIQRHWRKGETGSNRIVFSHVTAGAKKRKKGKDRWKLAIIRQVQSSARPSTCFCLFSRRHVSVGESLMAAHPHNVWLRLRSKTSNAFILK